MQLEESSVARVLDDEMLLSSIIEHVTLLQHRLGLRQVSMHFRAVLGSPHLWTALHLKGSHRPLCPGAPIPHQKLASLEILDSRLPAAPSLSLSLPSLTELSLSGSSNVDESLLRACFRHCGGALRRLDLSFVTMKPSRPGPELFDDLVQLQLLVARGVEGVDGSQMNPNRVQGSWVLQSLQQSRCSELEALILGWRSEFIAPDSSELEASPFLEPRFSEPVLVLPLARNLADICPKLRALTLSGYALIYDELLDGAFSTGELETLDLCGGQLGTDEGLAAALSTCAPTLRHLNVRGTRFGDASAAALARGGCNLERINVSCTPLTAQGLLMLSDASDRLQVVDVCYARACCKAEAMRAVCARHGARLQMLGMGGCLGLGTDDLAALLELTKSSPEVSSSLRHIGIGGCEGLHGASALAHVMSACGPSLTALSAHKLEDVSWEALASLLEQCPNLVSLDLAGSAPGSSSHLNTDGVCTSHGERETAFRRLWAERCAEGRVHAGRVDEFFVESSAVQVIRTADRAVVCPACGVGAGVTVAAGAAAADGLKPSLS